ncbi:amino acid transporter [Pseudoxanthomonas broegbernensis]|uniref:Arginine/agmatine antiporter n=1 Tax=Pseudoxanthomonas broegbernensis TaxID=83619 RepID=A0A7V8K848_9GAMM|nr:APC family permease [Pseudoxanthomonas broegbernensis]KAF1687370.1 amino acid transporter [Pseudoxanthomonas broegbernensis]MBB6065626.1 amino acid transporter [Pseudoxanthomonas broegbernensis]
MSAARDPGPSPGLVRAVGRWQIVGLSINDVVGSGIYLLPAATFVLLGPASVWAVLLAGMVVALLVLCYAQAASYFDQPGGSYLYAREAFGRFVGFEIGWMIWLTRIASAASLSNGLADATSRFWPAAAAGAGRTGVIAVSLALLTAVNVIGVKSAARTGVALVIGKLLPLLLFVAIGLFYVDWSWALAGGPPAAADLGRLGEAALLLLFAYAGFENIPAAAGEYRNPRRDVPFALLTMIATVTLVYVLVQLVAQGTLPGLADSATPLADAAARFGGEGLALLLTVGATVSILGTNSNTMMLGPRFLYALAADGYGPRFLAAVHPRFRTPAAAILVQGAIALALALWGSFVELALLSMVTRLLSYMGTAAAVLVLARRYRDRPDALRLPGGPLVPVAALLLSLGLLASASPDNLAAVGIALLVGAAIYRFPRRDS